MTETSGFYTTSATPSGHQVSSYTQVIAAKAWAILASCNGKEGVAPGYLNELVGSVPAANTARIGTGGAIVDGQWYENGAAVDVTIPSAVGGGNTRIDRIVLRITWASFQCVITRIAGTDAGSPVPPAITQTPGTVYDIMLYQALVNTSGTVTLTDERVWGLPQTDESTLTSAAGNLKIKDEGVTPTQIANRTRKFILEGFGYDSVGTISRASALGSILNNSLLSNVYATFICPQDYASGLTVTPLWFSYGASGNIYYKTNVYWAAVGETYDTHSSLGAYAALAGLALQWQIGTAMAVASPGAGDIITIHFYRDATDPLDTYTNVLYFLGFIISYTADS